jgi:anthranilate phosphoribosyltransferase
VTVETGAHGVGEPRPLEARSLGLPPSDARSIRGGDPAENARIIRDLFSGARGPRRDSLVLNSAAALWIAGAAPSLSDGTLVAAEQLDAGRAMKLLDRFIALSRNAGDE